MKKNKKLIPQGFYCYEIKNGRMIKCPYWRMIEERPEQYNGWCDYLGKGDIELNKEMVLTDENDNKVNVEDVGFPVSLLWDMCKMCQINEEE